jgi:hypothetical protein
MNLGCVIIVDSACLRCYSHCLTNKRRLKLTRSLTHTSIPACSTGQRHQYSHVRQKPPSFDDHRTCAPFSCGHVANPPPCPFHRPTPGPISIHPVPLRGVSSQFAMHLLHIPNICSQDTKRSSAPPSADLSLLLHFSGFHLTIGGT